MEKTVGQQQRHLGSHGPPRLPGLASRLRHRDGNLAEVRCSRLEFPGRWEGQDVRGRVLVTEAPVEPAHGGVGGEEERQPRTRVSRLPQEAKQDTPAGRRQGPGPSIAQDDL
jgi:hypothetical protein